MRPIFFFLFLVFVHAAVAGCSCDDESESKEKHFDPSKPPPPLVVQELPPALKGQVEVHPQSGATDARPIAIVVAKDAGFCRLVRAEWKNSGHVVCIDAPLQSAGPTLKRAVTYLAKTYPRHTGKPPVHLFADPDRSDVGWRLMLEEPGFFAYAFLSGLKERAITHTTLSALHSRGARELFLTLDTSKRLEMLSNIASRRGLRLHALGKGPDSMRRAIAEMKKRDARLVPPSSSKSDP